MAEQPIDADDWTEQDLLTRSEASGRLKEAVAEAEAELAEARKQSAPDPAVVDALQGRLDDLREALPLHSESAATA
ncbi:hypothetical protein [Nocardiopsis oceani]